MHQLLDCLVYKKPKWKDFFNVFAFVWAHFYHLKHLVPDKELQKLNNLSDYCSLCKYKY